MRSDNLEKINYMLLGPIRHKFTAKERNAEQGIAHLVIPRYTRVLNTPDSEKDINGAYELISDSPGRNEQILEDIRSCVSKGRTPVILTRYKKHAKLIYDCVRNDADYVFILYGDHSARENESIREQLKEVPDDKSLILVATGQKIGEGFDYPRLDTLMLASPISFAGRLEQYVGRLNRDYKGKKDVVVYDYIDSHVRVFNNMYLKRLRTYKKLGFRVAGSADGVKQEANAIYDPDHYAAVFERDLIEAEKEIIISSPQMTQRKVDRLIYLMKARQEAGVWITVITENPENILYGNPAFAYTLIQQLQCAGVKVEVVEEDAGRFAVIDRLLVWYGSVDFLGKEDARDCLIRVKDERAASELLEIL